MVQAGGKKLGHIYVIDSYIDEGDLVATRDEVAHGDELYALEEYEVFLDYTACVHASHVNREYVGEVFALTNEHHNKLSVGEL